jgi:hypothetical protein
VYNIQKAVSRLDYAPKLKEIQVTDIQKGLGVFTPRPDKAVSFAALKETLKKAGYTLDAADITVVGTLIKNDNGWTIVSKASGQSFVLTGPDVDRVITGTVAGARVEITGGEGANAHEAISPSSAKPSASLRNRSLYSTSFVNFTKASFATEERAVSF